MPKLIRLDSVGGTEVSLAFYCPGCCIWHSFRIKSEMGNPTWEWNGSMEKPTFPLSLLVNKNQDHSASYPRCHLFVRDGKIQFLSDCTHGLAGMTVEMEEDDE